MAKTIYLTFHYQKKICVKIICLKVSIDIYGYKNLIVQSNIQRLKYLEKIKRENIQSKTCLLAGDCMIQ